MGDGGGLGWGWVRGGFLEWEMEEGRDGGEFLEWEVEEGRGGGGLGEGFLSGRWRRVGMGVG